MFYSYLAVDGCAAQVIGYAAENATTMSGGKWQFHFPLIVSAIPCAGQVGQWLANFLWCLDKSIA